LQGRNAFHIYKDCTTLYLIPVVVIRTWFLFLLPICWFSVPRQSLVGCHCVCVCESACNAEELCLCGFVMNKPEDMFVIFSLQNTVPGGKKHETEDIVSSLWRSGYTAVNCELMKWNTRRFMDLEGHLKVSLNTRYSLNLVRSVWELCRHVESSILTRLSSHWFLYKILPLLTFSSVVRNEFISFCVI
jgi:hypothetical protein